MADTHCHKHNESTFEPFPCSDCKSGAKISGQGCSSKLEGAVNKFVERRVDLAGRQRYLKDKVSTMERSIPALMAFNMWMSGQKCKDAPLCKIREIMNTFSPYPDPTEHLLQNLKTTVQDLDQEISELHDRIIAADVELEERGMELESLELSNEEMDKELKTLEKEIEAESTLSLHSIHSEDLICLSRIRQLGEEERSLKCCIKQLEEKEMAYRQQMESLLVSRDFQNSLGGSQMARRLKELEASDRKWRCTYQTQKYNMQQMKKKIIEKSEKLTKLANETGKTHPENEENSSSKENKEKKPDNDIISAKKQEWTSWTKNNSKNRLCGKTAMRSCCVPLPKSSSSKKKSYSCSADSRPGCAPQNSRPKFCSVNPLCQPPAEISGLSGCRCSCKGKCARGKSESPCNCGTESKSNYDPRAKKLDSRNFEENSSDDEFRECDCGCNDDDVPGTCLRKI